MNATKPNKSISVKKNTGECFSTKLKRTCINSGTFEAKKILPEKITYVPLAPSHSILPGWFDHLVECFSYKDVRS